MPLSSHSTSVQLLSCKLEFNSSFSVDLIIFHCLLLIIYFDSARTKKTRKKQASRGGCFLSEKPWVAFVFIVFCLFIRTLSISLLSYVSVLQKTSPSLFCKIASQLRNNTCSIFYRKRVFCQERASAGQGGFINVQAPSGLCPCLQGLTQCPEEVRSSEAGKGLGSS